MCDNPINDIANAAGDAANAVGDAATDAANAVAGAVGDGANAVAGAVGDAGNAAADAAKSGAQAVGNALGDIGHAASDVLSGAADVATSVGSFIAEHQSQIIAGAEIAANVALDATGVGAIGAAVISGVIAAGTDAAEGKGAGDALVDGLSAGLDRVLPGAGDAAKTVVSGIEHGESAGDIARDAGLSGVGAGGGPVLGAVATVNSDLAHHKDAGDIVLDLGKQYVSDASGNGAEANPLGPAVLSAADDLAHGKGLDAVGLDLVKQYVHNAAGGDASPTAQLTDTFFDDVKAGKSMNDTLSDLEHQAEGMASRVDANAPGGLTGALGNDPSGLGKYAATAASDLAHGKSPDDIAMDLGKQAAGDAVDASGLGDSVKDAVKGSGIDTSALDPLKPYADTAIHDLEQGKSLGDTAQDLGKQAAGDLVDHAAHDTGLADILHGLPGSDSSSGADLQMVGIQSLMSQRQQALEVTSQMLQSLAETAKSVIGNVDGHDGSAPSDNGHWHPAVGSVGVASYPVAGEGTPDQTTITTSAGGIDHPHSAIIPFTHEIASVHHDFMVHV